MTATLPSFAVVTCDVFQEELAVFGGDAPPWRAIEYLEMGLHDRPDELRIAVQQKVKLLDQREEVDSIVLAYGLCGNGLVGVGAGRCQLILPKAHDCISILLGSAQRHQAVLKEEPHTYFYSPGWVRGRRVPGPDREQHLRDLYAERYSDDEEMIDDLVEADRSTFDNYRCATYVDLTDNQPAEQYCQRCADSLGWSYRRLAGDASMLRDLLSGRWDAERFVTIPSGRKIGLDDDGHLPAAT